MAPAIAMAVMGGVNALVQSTNNRKLGNEQMHRQRDLRAQANQLPTPKLPRELIEGKRMREIALAKGLPGMDIYKEQIEGNTANLAAKGKQAATSGGDYLTFLASLYGSADKQLSNLQTADANSRASQANQLGSYKVMLAQQEARNEEIKRNQQNELYKQANDLETAATENKAIADKQLTGAFTTTASGILGAFAADNSSPATNYKSYFDQQPVDAPAQMGADPLKAKNDIMFTNIEGVPFSPAEEAATKNILQQNGITPTGALSDIKTQQGFLKGMGLYDGVIDGSYGPKSQAAMQRYLETTGQDFVPQDLSYYYGQSFVDPKGLR